MPCAKNEWHRASGGLADVWKLGKGFAIKPARCMLVENECCVGLDGKENIIYYKKNIEE